MDNKFKLVSSYKPAGDQPRAISELVEGVRRGDTFQTLLGVTGSGKTFTVSNLIQEVQRPALIISPNKTLAAQLYAEFKTFFPENRVEFFISYYDYYQPEAYIVKSDTYIEKDFSINDEIDRLRLRATSALVEGRRDVIIVASVSCIYSIGKKEDFASFLFPLNVSMKISRQQILYRLLDMHYERNDYEFKRGTFRVRGDVIDVIPAYEDKTGIRIELFGDEIDKISIIDALSGNTIEIVKEAMIHPAKLFVTPEDRLQNAMKDIKDELVERLKVLRAEDKLLEAQRLEQRTLFDLEMMKEVGYCSGVENYSMHLTGRTYGDRPHCIFDFFPEDYLLIVDESHATIPQVRAMYNGDRSRKTSLVEHGFRLPSALENRPLKFEEFESLSNQTIFVSATPGPYELEKCEGVVVEQVIRPTGLLDPLISVRPIKSQIDDLLNEIRIRIVKKQRVLVTTLTKRMAEDLSDYLSNLNIKVAYIHSDVDSLERVEIIRDLRIGEYDVLVGVNLLREGLDLPEVSLVAILDADKEGFLRSERSLLQIAGRTARNIEGLVILYADRITNSMNVLISETNRRRIIQQKYNEENGINPQTVYKSIEEILSSTSIADVNPSMSRRKSESKVYGTLAAEPVIEYMNKEQLKDLTEQMFIEMKNAARDLDFERAAELRDEIGKLREKLEKMSA
ncbi:MAG: excinuclease ABC subunit UvrB [Candidatus Kapabacteria bacterium]|nr:excinuclease ABC subunit UvrB [Ignavibacteriota bacterium]MCW5885914.1 excinuclease ABC subunit UvrB [Candidatus Kapabacteria bacterium]